MKLLTRTWRDLLGLLSPSAWFSYGVLAVMLALEVVGRQAATTDVHDLCAVAGLCVVSWLVVHRHRQAPLAWVDALLAAAHRVREFLGSRLAIEIGIDLRGIPPLPRGLPRTVVLTLLLLGIETALVCCFAWGIPLGLRAIAVRVCYVGYLGFLVVLWGAIFSAILLAIAVPVEMIHDASVNRFVGSGRPGRRLRGMALVCYFTLLLMGACYLPGWLPLLLCVLALLVNLLTTVLPANPDVQFLWRYRNHGLVRSIPWGRWVVCGFTLVTLGTLNLVLLASGSTLVSSQAPASEGIRLPAVTGEVLLPRDKQSVPAWQVMPITTCLGLILAWLAPGALTARVMQRVLARSRDPARPCRPVLHISGELPAAQQLALRHCFTPRGWSVRFAPSKADPLDVRVRIVEQPASLRPGAREWPLHVTCDALQSDSVLERLKRRDEVQKRRRLLAGLQRLFKYAAARTFGRGAGFWVAPHFWFIPGLTRDTPEEDLDTIPSGIIGPPYFRVLPRPVRHHAYVILRTLQIDLIFVEDGVGFRRFRRVLLLMFEMFDVYNGRRRADEFHFQGVPGTRVLIHEYQLSEPFRSEVYPEPDYENLGRARILHIFRDRGEQTERLDAPQDITDVPAPSLAL